MTGIAALIINDPVALLELCTIFAVLFYIVSLSLRSRGERPIGADRYGIMESAVYAPLSGGYKVLAKASSLGRSDDGAVVIPLPKQSLSCQPLSCSRRLAA